MTDSTNAERQRRYRAKHRNPLWEGTVTGVSKVVDNGNTDTQLERPIDEHTFNLYQRKGRVLAMAFHIAWARFSVGLDQFRRMEFHSFQGEDWGDRNSPKLDFWIRCLRKDNSLLIVTVEVKNWHVAQWLDFDRTWNKVFKKYVSEIATQVVIEDRDPHPNDTWVHLLIATPEVHFTPEAQNLLNAFRFTIERVDKLPVPLEEGFETNPYEGVPMDVWRDYEDTAVRQMTEILKRVFKP